MSTSTVSMDALLRDFYPLPGTRLKQYVVDMRREDTWAHATCPRVHVFSHVDNTGARCRNVGTTRFMHLQHDCCYVCNDFGEALRGRPEIAEWLTEKARRPPIEADTGKLSDEYEPDHSFEPHPFFDMVKK